MSAIETAAVVFARGGSVGLPRKNLRSVGGRPLVSWPLEYAIRTAPNAAFISTDHPGLANCARASGAAVIDRPAELATSTAVVFDAWRHAVTELLSRFNQLKYIVCLEGSTVHRRWMFPEMLQIAENTNCDFVRCLTESSGIDHPDWQNLIEPDGRVQPLQFSPPANRQQLPQRFKWSSGPVLARVTSLMKLPPDKALWREGIDTRGVIVQPGDFLAIDSQLDLDWAEFLLARDCPATIVT